MKLFLKNLLFTVLVPGTVAGWVPLGLTAGRPAAPGGIALALAVALWVLGGAIYTSCVWQFAAFGRGTPAPIDAPKRLVIRGPYRFVRNPMYVGVLAAILGWAVRFRSVSLCVYALGVAIVFHCFITRYEEPRLRQEFGEAFDAYRSGVPRWMPGRSARRGERAT